MNSSADAPTSGWHFSASPRYAALISRSLAEAGTPRTSYSEVGTSGGERLETPGERRTAATGGGLGERMAAATWRG